MLVAGSTINGRYRLDSLIGEGGMASVWRAEDDNLKRAVAIKLLYLSPHRDASAAVEQFLREARIAAAVQHRNVVHTMDFGTTEEGVPFMVMELLHGESLATRMEQGPRLGVDEWVRIADMTLRGLAAVHEAGIVHRDLKPQNIFLQRDGDGVYPKILDFGISRSLTATERASPIATQQGFVIGTPHYMSPEQARGEAQVDPRADIYSVATILYEGLAGRLPFDADNTADLLVKIITSAPVPLRELCPPGTEAIADCVTAAMSPDRVHRFSDARTFRRALQRAYEQAFSVAASGYSELPLSPSGELPYPEDGPVAPIPARAPRNDVAPAAWGDFEGLGGRQSAASVTHEREFELASARTIATSREPAGPPPRPPSRPLAERASATATRAASATSAAAPEPFGQPQDEPMFGDSPLDAFSGSAAVALELDYAPRHEQRRTQDALPREKRAAERPSQDQPRVGRATITTRAGAAWWIFPGLVAVLLCLALIAPSLFSSPPPDQEQAQAREATNAATRGSSRVLRRERPEVSAAALPQERELLE